jgi:hypothetical protein
VAGQAIATHLAASARRQCRLDEKSRIFVTQDARAVMLLGKNVGVVMRSHVIWDLVTHLDVSNEIWCFTVQGGKVNGLPRGRREIYPRRVFEDESDLGQILPGAFAGPARSFNLIEKVLQFFGI